LKIGGLMGMTIFSKKILAGIFGMEKIFPIVEVSAEDYFELGQKIGKSAKTRIQAGLKRRKKWLSDLKKFADADRNKRFEPFLSALQQNFPNYYDELKGIAQGAEVDFDLLFTLNLNPELSTMMRAAREEDCSTVMVKSGDRIILGHNEDGSEQYLDLMFLLRAKAPSGIEFFVLSYPGIVSGNGPGINSKGIVHSCNYIGSKKFQEGVPRYFIDRAMLEASTMEQAISFGSHPSRAYSKAHNLVSISEKRAVMIETSIDVGARLAAPDELGRASPAPTGVAIKEVNGILYRTNNYILPEMQDEPEFASYQISSVPRLKALEAELKNIDPEKISAEQVHLALSSHKNDPMSPCRHKNKIIPGATLGQLLFDSSAPQFRFYYQAPCKNIFQEFPKPEG